MDYYCTDNILWIWFQTIACLDRGAKYKVKKKSKFSLLKLDLRKKEDDIDDDSSSLPAFTIVNSGKKLHREKFSADFKLNNLRDVDEDSKKEVENPDEEKYTFGEKASHKIDHAALIIFPTGFFVFMVSYWIYYA